MKKVYGVLVVTICALFIVLGNASAAEIYSESTLKEAFNGKNVTISDKTIKLNENVEIEDVINFMDEEYILDLNGHTLKVAEIYVISDSLTINDSTKKGVIDTAVLQVGDYDEEGNCTKANFIVNQVILEASGTGDYGENIADLFIEEGATVIINNGTFENAIWNNGGTLTINNADAKYVARCI